MKNIKPYSTYDFESSSPPIETTKEENELEIIETNVNNDEDFNNAIDSGNNNTNNNNNLWPNNNNNNDQNSNINQESDLIKF
jgi:hypothetical protein